MICAELVRALESRHPGFQFLVSTTTTTGMGELRKRLPEHIAKIYFPVDFKGAVRRALDEIKPKAIVFVEAEIWPNLIWYASERGIPLFLANARISDRSYPRYQKLPFLFKKLFASFAAVGAQSDEYSSRLLNVGCAAANVTVTGNIKFDTAKVDNRNSLDTGALLNQLGAASDALVLLGGSIHKGEEKILAKQFLKLRNQFPNLFLVLVPRHFERAREVGKMLEKLGLKFKFRSKVTSDTNLNAESLDCLVVDTTGELMSFYRNAAIVFVGKSLKAKGGQNPIEPAAVGRATVFGPNMQNFADVARIFLAGNGAIQVQNTGELERTLAALLENPNRRQALGERAQQIVLENQGALERTVEMISRRIVKSLAP